MESKSQSRSHTIQHVELPITGSSELFPVHQVYCVGRNYADHAIEMGHDPDREPPFSSSNRRMRCFLRVGGFNILR